jgi:hypothetical protein
MDKSSASEKSLHSEKSSASEKSQQTKRKTNDPDVEYWKKLAEDRKQALRETLAQNEELHEEVELGKTELEMVRAELEQVQEQNELLTAENEQLQRLVAEAAARGFTLI